MNKILVKISAAILISTAVSSCVTTNAEGIKQVTYKKNALSGERTKIDWAVAVKGDCSARVIPELRILQAPQHGTVDIVHEKIDGRFHGTYAKCTGKDVQGTSAYYTSKKGFIGSDKVIVRNSYKDGVVVDGVAEINVVR
ncbi:hypothetical protein [Agrobacterium larrymoorei]|uniref:Lipoprotein n=1 Tax=Agrobacterium larrymoorei TaxID=160699 RepID=A0AAJ2BDS3_9HYPH|nr:hypothetical protein [Agrobacterium larrymoorei]MDQ1186836.1 hypothetical protein [Agrobacterium larrymoorei]MDR6103117.1 hypothetical protein [Agrobacterium larrymoorei]